MNMSTAPEVSLGRRTAPMSRWKAAGIHLLLSAGIAGVLVAMMLLVWYPWPLFEVAGGSGLVIILVGVDVVLGPLITLVIFKAGKKGLKFDLAVIAFLQLAALAYGVHAVYVVRPVYMVYNVDRFNLVAAIDLDPADLAAAKRAEFRSLPIDGPKYIAAVQPQDPAGRQKIFESALAGKDVHLFAQQYVPYAQEAQNALRGARGVGILMQRDPAGKVAKFLESSGRGKDSVRFLPLRARTSDAAVLLDAKSGDPLGIVAVDPW
jgi:hypothetical protein